MQTVDERNVHVPPFSRFESWELLILKVPVSLFQTRVSVFESSQYELFLRLGVSEYHEPSISG